MMHYSKKADVVTTLKDCSNVYHESRVAWYVQTTEMVLCFIMIEI